MGWRDTYAHLIGSYSPKYIPDELVAALLQSHNLAIFFRVDSDPGLHLWCGTADIPAGFDAVDPDGTVYIGAGRLLSIPVLEILINGQSGRTDFGLSGIDPEDAGRLQRTMPNLRGKNVMIGFTTLDEHFQPLTKIISLWNGQASHVREAQPPVPPGQNRTVSLSLAVVTGSASRSRPSLSLWSNAHQQADWPGDLGCQETADLERGVAPSWPAYG